MNADVPTREPVFSVTFSETIDAASWGSSGLVVQAPDGSKLPGVYSTDTTGRIGYFAPSFPLQVGVTYVLGIGPVTDLAGNALAPVPSWTATVHLAPTIVIAAAPAVIALGDGSTLSGRTTYLDGRPVAIEVRPATATTYGRVTDVTPAGGRFALVVLPRTNAWYRATYAGSAGLDGASSAPIRILVRRSVALTGYSTTTVARTRIGRSSVLVAQITPVAAGVPVTFRLYRYDPARRAYLYLTSRSARSTASGQVRTTWTPTTAGSYYWRVAVGSTVDYANNLSSPYRWSVTR
jgi:hypothetical protein